MSLNREQLWSLLEPEVQAEGLELFEIEVPSPRGGVLRVTISREGSGEIGIEDCAKVSRRIGAIDRFEDLIPANVTLEVSSPGINRRLRRAEHFQGAIGEHVKLKVAAPEQGFNTSMKGTLVGFNGETLEFREDDSGEKRNIPLRSVEKARVDFQFD